MLLVFLLLTAFAQDVTPDDMDAPPMSSVGGADQGYPPQQPYSQAPAAYAGGAAAPAGPRASGVAASYPNARALYAFVGQDASELSFSEGEIIAIMAQVRRLLSCGCAN